MGEMEAPRDGWTCMGSGVFIVRNFGWKIISTSLLKPKNANNGDFFYHGFREDILRVKVSPKLIQ